MSITNSTIAANISDTGRSGGIHNLGIVLLSNTILANQGNCFEDSITSNGHNLSSDNTCNFGNAGDLNNTDPLLGPLQDNGGPTLTHALLTGSPTIDAGDNSAAPATDQRGVERPQGSSSDIGAFEVVLNQSPDCSNAGPSQEILWPPNHKFVSIKILGVTDADTDTISINIDGIRQDEPVDTDGDGEFAPDGIGVNTDTANIRAERSGTKKVPGNGRVYHISYTADDGHGGNCSGEVTVGVPHDQGKRRTPVDGGALYDSTMSY